MTSIFIDKHEINREKPPFVIAEAGVNHNGDLDIAKKLALEAKRAGADAVKFQTFRAENLATADAETAAYQVYSTGEKNQKKLLKRFELKKSDYDELIGYCRSLNITCFSTPFSREDADFLYSLDVPAFKISSGDLISLPLLQHIAKFDKPIILSTGMATIVEVKEAVETIKKYNKQLILLQCTSSYPCEIRYMNLNVIHQLEMFGYPVGLSDHSVGIGASVIAAYIGACTIEKHLTLDNTMEGPDHSASLEPDNFARLVSGVKEAYRRRREEPKALDMLIAKYEPTMSDKIELVMGLKEKMPVEPEFEIMLKGRKSIVAKMNLSKGTRIPDDIESVLGRLFELKRPGNGLKPKYLVDILGKTIVHDIKEDKQIRMTDFA